MRWSKLEQARTSWDYLQQARTRCSYQRLAIEIIRVVSCSGSFTSSHASNRKFSSKLTITQTFRISGELHELEIYGGVSIQ